MPSADRTYPDRPWVGVGVVVFRGNDILLVRRAKPPNQGQWSLPGGGQDIGETVFEAARREVVEEAGIQVRPVEVLTTVDSVHRDDDGRVKFHYTLVEVLAFWEDGDIRAGDDAEAVRWADAQAATELVTWSETRRIIGLAEAWRRRQPPPPRLPAHPSSRRFLSSPLGRLWRLPGTDTAILTSLTRGLFPLSRAWAAAQVADGDVARFADQISLSVDRVRRVPGLAAALAATSRLAQAASAADAQWRRTLAPSASDPAGRVAAETRRLDAADNLARARLRFLPLLARGPAAVAFDIPTPTEVTEAHGARLADPGAFALPKPLPQPTETPRLLGHATTDHWLHLPDLTGRAGTDCRARVFDPPGPADKPAVVFLHGVANEPDQIRAPLREIEPLLAAGLKVIAPEGPFHGRRRPLGLYSGEALFGRPPLGALDYFAAHVPEVGCLIAHARATGSRRVGLFGTSLGGFAAQMVAGHCRNWPDAARPDALFLLAIGDDLTENTMESRLAERLGIAATAVRAGWSADRLALWQPLMTPPPGPPAVDPSRMIAVLGRRDDVVPYRRGLARVKAWGVPDSNLFRRAGGHFTTPLSVVVDQQPVQQFADLLFGNRPRRG